MLRSILVYFTDPIHVNIASLYNEQPVFGIFHSMPWSELFLFEAQFSSFTHKDKD